MNSECAPPSSYLHPQRLFPSLCSPQGLTQSSGDVAGAFSTLSLLREAKSSLLPLLSFPLLVCPWVPSMNRLSYVVRIKEQGGILPFPPLPLPSQLTHKLPCTDYLLLEYPAIFMNGQDKKSPCCESNIHLQTWLSTPAFLRDWSKHSFQPQLRVTNLENCFNGWRSLWNCDVWLSTPALSAFTAGEPFRQQPPTVSTPGVVSCIDHNHCFFEQT